MSTRQGNVQRWVDLGSTAGVACSCALTDEPWTLDVDALVVPIDPGFGTVAQSVASRFPELGLLSLDPTLIDPNHPPVLDIDGSRFEVPIGRIVIVSFTASGSAAREDAAAAGEIRVVVSAAVLAALEVGDRRIGLPMLGAGAYGLSDDELGEVLIDAVGGVIKEHAGRLDSLVLYGQDGSAIAAISRAWQAAQGRATMPVPSGPPPRKDPPAATTKARPRRAEPVAPEVSLSTSARSVLSASVTLAAPEVPSFDDVVLTAFRRALGKPTNDVAAVLLRKVGERHGRRPADVVSEATIALGRPKEIDLEAYDSELFGRPGIPGLVEAALDVTRELGQPPVVHIRHLLGAAVRRGLSDRTMEVFGQVTAELAVLLVEAVAEVLPEEPLAAWRRLLGLRDAAGPPAAPSAAGPPAAPGAAGPPEAPNAAEAPDEPSGQDVADAEPIVVLGGGISRDLVDPELGIPIERDYLALRTYVEMLATVIAKEETPLPLSIGLFGEWGSGKSYFMGLLREQVSTLSKSGDQAYLTDVVQIGFNAWSYADSNLWASLGDEIFNALAGPGAGAADDDEERRTRLRVELDRTVTRARELDVAMSKASTESARLRSELDEARARRDASLTTLLGSTARAGLSGRLDGLLRRAGIGDATRQAQVLADELTGARRDVGALRLALAGWKGFGLALIAVALVILLGAARLWPEAVWRGTEVLDWVKGCFVALTAWLTMIAGFTAAARRGIRSIGEFAVAVRGQGAADELRALRPELDKVRQAEADEQVVKAQLEEVLARAGELGRELVELSPGQRLYGFLNERASSQDYRREQGLISTIRRDFEQLVALMNRWRDERQAGGDDKAPRPIDRIVLYIDDLDRCSPKQVVEVLQAVHLLLAFELFVVVVGVDPRWLLHSLRDQYPRILAGRDAAGDALPEGPDESWLTTPQDYLEKIFNIPFVLPGLTPSGFESLIRKLSAEPPAVRKKSKPKPDGASRHLPPEPDADPEMELAFARAMARRESARESNEIGPATQPGQPPAAAPVVQKGSELDAVRAGVEHEPQPLSEPELAFLAALAPLVGSPRAAKRLLNLYRMVRSTQNLGDASQFLGDGQRSGEYQAVAYMLGVQTAYPDLLCTMLWGRAAPSLGVVGGVCVRRTKVGGPWKPFVRGLRPREKDGVWVNDVSGPLDAQQRAEWEGLLARGSRAADLVTLTSLEPLRAWGPHVERFSFARSDPRG